MKNVPDPYSAGAVDGVIGDDEDASDAEDDTRLDDAGARGGANGDDAGDVDDDDDDEDEDDDEADPGPSARTLLWARGVGASVLSVV